MDNLGAMREGYNGLRTMSHYAALTDVSAPEAAPGGEEAGWRGPGCR
jgi:hypothetical protein